MSENKKSEKNKSKDENIVEDKIFKKINIITVVNTSRNLNKNIFHHNITYNKVSNTSEKPGDSKGSGDKNKNTQRKFINTSTNYDSTADEKNFSNMERNNSTTENNKLKLKPKSKFLTRK